MLQYKNIFFARFVSSQIHEDGRVFYAQMTSCAVHYDVIYHPSLSILNIWISRGLTALNLILQLELQYVAQYPDGTS